MTKGIRTVAIIFLLIALPALSRAASPQLKLLQESYDFGEVYQGTTVKHTFRFENVGDELLEIGKVRTSCGCTAALLSEKQLAPGDTGELKVSFDSAHFSGQVTKTIYLYTNDPLEKVKQMYVRGRVKPQIAQDPLRLDLGLLKPEEEKAFEVTLTNQGEEVVELSSVKITAAELQAELSTRKLEPGETARVDVRVRPRKGKNRINGYVLIGTNSANVPELRIPVYGTVAD